MASGSKLIKESWNNFKHAPISGLILGLTSGLVIAAILALDLILPFMSILTFPLFILPIVFSATLQHTLFKTQGQLTFATSVKSFGLYFTPIFRSSFRFFVSLAKGVITFLVLEMLLSFIISSVLQSTSKDFVNALTDFYAMLNSESTSISDIEAALTNNNGILFNYMCSILIPSYFVGVMFMLYNNSRYSLVIYYQMGHPAANPRFSRFVHMDTIKRHRFEMLGDYFLLNWPLFILLAGGFAGGAVLGYFWKHDLLNMMACALVLGGAGFVLFFPFYLSNQEALFEKYAPWFDESTKHVTNFMVQTIQRNIEMSVEEKQRLEESLKQSGSPEQENEDKKKDSDESL